MPKKITYKHDFFEKSLMGLNRYLLTLFKPYEKIIGQEFPIGISNTGDEKYLFDMIADKKIYGNIPRWDIHIAGLSFLPEQNTNPHEYGFFEAVDNSDNRIKEFTAPINRKTIEITLNSKILFENIINYFSFIEVYLFLTNIRHTFSFYHSGKRHLAVFELPNMTDDEYNTTLGFSADKRQHEMDLSFILQLQFPAYQIYGIPGSGFEGNNGFADPNNNDNPNNNDGSAGNGEDSEGNEQSGPILNGEPMAGIIHNLHMENPEPEGIVSTIFVKKDKDGKTIK